MNYLSKPADDDDDDDDEPVAGEWSRRRIRRDVGRASAAAAD